MASYRYSVDRTISAERGREALLLQREAYLTAGYPINFSNKPIKTSNIEI